MTMYLIKVLYNILHIDKIVKYIFLKFKVMISFVDCHINLNYLWYQRLEM